MFSSWRKTLIQPTISTDGTWHLKLNCPDLFLLVVTDKVESRKLDRYNVAALYSWNRVRMRWLYCLKQILVEVLYLKVKSKQQY